MNMKYDRLVMFFDGAINGDYKFKKEYNFTDESFTRDLTSNKTSSLSISDVDNLIVKGDILFINNHLGLTILGIVTSVEKDIKTSFKTVTFNYGADIRNTPFYIPGNTTVMNINNDYNYTSLRLDVNTSVDVTANDEVLDLDVAIRQMMRKQPVVETMTIENGIEITESNDDIFDIDIRESDITNKTIKLASDTFNKLRLYNSEDRSLYVDYYLSENGDVTTNISDQQLPVFMTYEDAGIDEYNNLAFATSKIKEQEYDNKIEFTIPLKTNIKALQFNDSFLSRKVRVHIDGNIITTIISAYTLNNNTSVSVILGLSRSRLTEQLKKYKNKGEK